MPAEFLRSKSHGLVRHYDAAFGQQIFDHCMGDVVSWKSVTAIERITS